MDSDDTIPLKKSHIMRLAVRAKDYLLYYVLPLLVVMVLLTPLVLLIPESFRVEVIAVLVAYKLVEGARRAWRKGKEQ